MIYDMVGHTNIHYSYYRCFVFKKVSHEILALSVEENDLNNEQ